MARLAWFQWLAQAGDDSPVASLTEVVEQLLAAPSADGTRQIVVLASRDGGVGSGWLSDFGRLLRRIVRQRQADGSVDFVPEIVAVLIGTPTTADTANRTALDLELESARLEGACPRRVTYVPGDALLDAVDTESAFNYLLAVEAEEDVAAAAQAAEVGAALVERRARDALLSADRRRGDEGAVLDVRAIALHVMPTLVEELVRIDLLLRLLGPDVLFDLELAPNGGYRLPQVAEERTAADLAAWAADEPANSPWQQLLSASYGDFDAARLASGVASINRAWLEQAFAAALSRRMHGRRLPKTGQWARATEAAPGRIIPVLALMARRLREAVSPALQAVGSPSTVLNAVDQLATLADETAVTLSGWAAELATICAREGRRQAEVQDAWAALAVLPGRTYLDPVTTSDDVRQLAAACLERWLGGVDTLSLLREHLFLSVAVDDGRPELRLHADRSTADLPQPGRGGRARRLRGPRAGRTGAPAGHRGRPVVPCRKEVRVGPPVASTWPITCSPSAMSALRSWPSLPRASRPPTQLRR